MQDFKAFIQEDAADRVLQFLSVREKVVLGTVCKLCHAWVADRWYTADLSGPDVHRQLTWLAQQVPARMLKVSRLVCSYSMVVVGTCKRVPHWQ